MQSCWGCNATGSTNVARLPWMLALHPTESSFMARRMQL